MPIDLSQTTIKELFFEQMKRVTMSKLEDSFDLQFSGLAD